MGSIAVSVTSQTIFITQNQNHAKRSWRVRGYVHPKKMFGKQPNHCCQRSRFYPNEHCDVDETTGRMTSTYKTYAICGQIRRMGESDDCINRLAKKDGVISKNF